MQSKKLEKERLLCRYLGRKSSRQTNCVNTKALRLEGADYWMRGKGKTAKLSGKWRTVDEARKLGEGARPCSRRDL